jgi:hypothetical protein
VGGNLSRGEANAVSLTNTSTNEVVDAYRAGTSWSVLTEGAGSGATATGTGSQTTASEAPQGYTYQWDETGAVFLREHTADTMVLCFDGRTRIETPKGSCAVQDLTIGDLVATLDHGMQPIKWIHKTIVSRDHLTKHPNACPILIKKGSLGVGHPKTDLVVSPQHRVLLRSTICERMFGCAEVLIRAKALVGWDGVSVQAPRDDLTYVHILLERHELVFANGHPCETLFPGEIVFEACDGRDRARLEAIIDGLEQKGVRIEMARPLVSTKTTDRLLQRHEQNKKQLFA